MPHEDRVFKIMVKFHRTYKSDFPILPKLKKCLSTLNRCNPEVFANLRQDFEARKKACNAFEFKEKNFLEELEAVLVERIEDMKELIMLRTDSKATTEQHVHYKNKYKESEAAYKALEASSKEREDKLRKKSWKRRTAIKNLTEEVKKPQGR